MKRYVLIGLFTCAVLFNGCGNNPQKAASIQTADPSVALIQKKMGIILPVDSLVISLADSSQAFTFSLVTALTIQQTKDYFNNELTAKGYIALPAQPNDLARGLMRYSILKDLIILRVNPTSGKSTITFERRFKQL